MSATRWPTIRSLSSLLVTFKPGTLLRALLTIGGVRLEVAPDVAVEALVPKQPVTVTGYRSKQEARTSVVTEIRRIVPGSERPAR